MVLLKTNLNHKMAYSPWPVVVESQILRQILINGTSFLSISYLSNSEYWPLNGERPKQQQLQGVYRIVVTEPYLNQNRGQTRHGRGPVHESSVSCIRQILADKPISPF